MYALPSSRDLIMEIYIVSSPQSKLCFAYDLARKYCWWKRLSRHHYLMFIKPQGIRGVTGVVPEIFFPNIRDHEDEHPGGMVAQGLGFHLIFVFMVVLCEHFSPALPIHVWSRVRTNVA